MKSGIKHVNEWLIALALLIIIGFAGSYFVGKGIGNSFVQFFNPSPGAILIGLETVAAIDIFGGKIPAEIGIDINTVSILISMIILLMLGPWLLNLGYKDFEQKELNNKPWYWFMGACLSLVAITIIPILSISFTVFQNTQESAHKNSVKDLMRSELMEVGFETAQYEILEDGLDESFSIDELNMEDLKYDYAVESMQSDTLITLMVSNPELPDFEVRMEVRPYDRSVIRQLTN